MAPGVLRHRFVDVARKSRRSFACEWATAKGPIYGTAWIVQLIGPTAAGEPPIGADPASAKAPWRPRKLEAHVRRLAVASRLRDHAAVSNLGPGTYPVMINPAVADASSSDAMEQVGSENRKGCGIRPDADPAATALIKRAWRWASHVDLPRCQFQIGARLLKLPKRGPFGFRH